MLKFALVVFLPLSIIFYGAYRPYLTGSSLENAPQRRGTLERLAVTGGSVTLNLDLEKLSGMKFETKNSRSTNVHFDASGDSFFSIKVYNGELRGPIPGSIPLISREPADLPRRLVSSLRNLSLEHTRSGDEPDFVIRDSKTGFRFFEIEGHRLAYDAGRRTFSVFDGRLLVSKEFAADIGIKERTIVGDLAVEAAMRQIEVTETVNGEVVSNLLPAAENGTVPGPDVVVGDLFDLNQFGVSDGTYVGLAVGTESCNFGTQNLHWFENPNNDHPVIPQNLYRMSGGAANDERFEQIGQSNVKHAFFALTDNWCDLGCNQVGGSNLGSGCSDPYSATLNAGPNLGSRAWINPFTGFFPRNDSATPNNNHQGHVHTMSGQPLPAHKILTRVSDLNTVLNSGAAYFAEAQYVTPHEYAWCQANPTQCNMYNNVSYRRYRVFGTASPFAFVPNDGQGTTFETVRMLPAVAAWPGSTRVEFRPDPGNDGIGFVAYKVTQTSPGVWHYEYAVYNQNLDRAIRSFSVPLSAATTLSNIGFHAPPQHPGWTFDGTVNNTGYSSTPWTQIQSALSMTWSTETLAQNPNANAIRWGTMYNFRFDSNKPPQSAVATIGFLKTGEPITVTIQAPVDLANNLVVSGRVTTLGFRGVGNVRVSFSDGVNPPRITYTNSFGFYRLENLASGTYTITAFRLGHSFSSKQMAIVDNVSNVDFVSGQ